MDEETIKHFKRTLEDRRRELTAETAKLLTDLEEHSSNVQGPMDPVDFASSQAAVELTLRKQDRNMALIRDIEAALRRIRYGEFGICDECGDDISFGRLKVQPVATLCINCKRKLESSVRANAV